MSLIYRIEGKEGIGIFRSKGLLRPRNPHIREVHERFRTFPVPSDDGINMRSQIDENLKSKWFCGFKSYDCIREWLSAEELKAFVKRGFKVYLISVKPDSVQVGSKQIAFLKVGVIKKRDVTELLLKKFQA